MALAETTPKPIKQGVDRAYAEAVKAALESVGATVEISPSAPVVAAAE
jgi:ribosomal protein L7/L12